MEAEVKESHHCVDGINNDVISHCGLFYSLRPHPAVSHFRRYETQKASDGCLYLVDYNIR